MAVDMVNHPPHYTSNKSGVEVIELTKNLSFCAGNALKYVARHQHKGRPVEDLEKAIWYIKREIARLADGVDAEGVFVPPKEPVYQWINHAEDDHAVINAVISLYATQYTAPRLELSLALESVQALLEQVKSEEIE